LNKLEKAIETVALNRVLLHLHFIETLRGREATLVIKVKEASRQYVEAKGIGAAPKLSVPGQGLSCFTHPKLSVWMWLHLEATVRRVFSFREPAHLYAAAAAAAGAGMCMCVILIISS